MAKWDATGAAMSLLSLLLLVLKTSAAGKYNTAAKPLAGKLNVHFVAHSHDDMGWLKTVDQYYEGTRNDIQQASVKDILETVTLELEANPDRKYVQVETGFFARWWREQEEETKTKVKKLVATGQVEFINGGWCMHDEATTHYLDMIDQTTYGHRFLKRELGVIPKHGWQIDTFGHSAIQGYLLGAEVGFQSMYTARVDYQDRAKRWKKKSLEMIWRASDTLGSSAEIFFGIFPVHYNPPDTFELELSNLHYTPVQDDEALEGYNVDERVESLVQAAQQQASLTRTEHIMWTMGDDFTYQNAETWFTNMDKLIHYSNLDGRVNVLYSNPSIYLDAKKAANLTWPLKTDSASSYWTGYFTSRAALKGYVRKLSGYLQVARQLEFLVGRSSVNTDELQDAMATVQHHDGVSGTEKQAVADDYTTRLYKGATIAEAVVNSALGCLSSGADCRNNNISFIFEQCGHLNITYCAASESASAGENLVLVAYNPLAWPRVEYVRVLVSHTEVAVTDSEGKHIESQLIPVSDVERRIRSFYVQVELGVKPIDGPFYWLVFEVSIPSLGFTSYVIGSSEESAAQLSSVEVLIPEKGVQPVLFANENVELHFSSENGKLLEMVDLKRNTTLSVNQEYMYYVADDGYDGQASGAYIFLPLDDTAWNVSKIAEVSETTIIRGPAVDEVHHVLSSWVTQVIRLHKGQEHAEIEFTIGPIPIDDGVGKEVISRFSTGLASSKTFYTDSNGRDFIKRARNHRHDWNLEVVEAVAGNYYPVNLGLYISDGKIDFSLLVDRAVGGASINDGEVEVMLHRRLLVDDGRGVDEPLSERVCLKDRERASPKCEGLTVKGKYYISAMPKDDAAAWRRSLGLRIFSPAQLAFTKQLGSGKTFSAVPQKSALPPNVALLTLQELEDGLVLLRLGHLYQAKEHSQYSKLATVDLKNIFVGRSILEVTEMNLSANQAKSGFQNFRWKLEDEADGHRESLRGRKFDAKTLIVELEPMEIRTFQLKF